MSKVKLVVVISVTAFISFAAALIFFSSNGINLFCDTIDSTDTNQRNSLNNSIFNERRNILTETVAETSPAVVGINVTQIREYRDPFFNPFMNDPFFNQFFGDRSYRQKVRSLGSGFFISSDGYIVTNDHVAGDAIEIVVTLTNGRHLPAKVIGSDPVSDICLLKVEGEDFPYLKAGDSDDVIIGEWVIALGNPFGLFDVNDKPTVTIGVVSAAGMNLDPVNDRYYLDMLQTDAAINGGNSGGPLVNSLGEVVGMNTLIFTANGGQGSIGLGFAIPVNKVLKIVNELKEIGKIDRNFYTGIAVQNLDNNIADYYGLETTRGVIVTKILRGSPADNAGIKPGDIIIMVDEYKINNEKTLLGVLQEYRTGQTATMHILREDEELSLSMTLEER